MAKNRYIEFGIRKSGDGDAEGRLEQEARDGAQKVN